MASKMDVVNKAKLAKLKRYCKRKKLELFPVSAVTGEGVEELKWAMAERVGRNLVNLARVCERDSPANVWFVILSGGGVSPRESKDPLRQGRIPVAALRLRAVFPHPAGAYAPA